MTATETIEFIQSAKAAGKPFFGLVDMSLPHPKYFEMPTMPAASISLEQIPVPPSRDMSDVPSLERWLRSSKDLESMRMEDRQRIIRAYYSMCEFADRQIERILNALDEAGLTENTLVIYTADHGDFAAEHNCYEKWDTSFLECIIHVPLILRLPTALPAGHRVTSLVELLDLMPTICDLAGLSIPSYVQGRSLIPVATGATATHREFAFCEGGVEPELAHRAAATDAPGSDPVKQEVLVNHPEALYRAKMVRTERYKYIHRIAGDCEFYDLTEDPMELNNRIEDPTMKQQIQHMKDLLLKHLIESESKLPEIGQCYA